MSDEVREVAPEDEELKALLGTWKTVAIVGLSSDPTRPSLGVAQYLQDHGYRIVPVNPKETEVLGQQAYATLLDIPFPVDVVDVFRRAEATPEIARQAVQIGAKAFWLQEGIVSMEAADIAYAGGLDVVMGICMRAAHRRVEEKQWTVPPMDAHPDAREEG